VKAQTPQVDEVIVVVDHNPDLFRRVGTELSGVLAVENSYQRGLSGARNTAVETARGSLVAFLDDDATAAPDWLAILARACRDPVVLGAGGRVLPNWLGPRPVWFPDEFLWVLGCTYRGIPERAATVRNLYGGCFCIRRSVLAEVGGFRVELGRVGSNGMGCEETELCIRAARQRPGQVFRYEPEAIIRHEVPRERATWSYFRSRCFAEGVSKARLTQIVGAQSGLSSERSYAARTLPLGAVRELTRAIAQGKPAHASRAGAIAAGLSFTAAGYAWGRLRDARLEGRSRKKR
jgi:GT2 family glycosyltransferase